MFQSDHYQKTLIDLRQFQKSYFYFFAYYKKERLLDFLISNFHFHSYLIILFNCMNCFYFLFFKKIIVSFNSIFFHLSNKFIAHWINFHHEAQFHYFIYNFGFKMFAWIVSLLKDHRLRSFGIQMIFSL